METTAVKAQRLLEEIARMKVSAVEKPPEGYLDVPGWSKQFKLQRSQTRRYLNGLVKLGKLKAVRVRQNIKGRIQKVTFYG